MGTDSHGRDSEDLGILADLLRRLTFDWNRNDLQELSYYRAAYPGYEATVESEYRAFLATETEAPERAILNSMSPDEEEALPHRIGPYLVLELLGKGGQGIVYRARDTRLPRDVALKLFTASSAAPLAERQRFQREAEVAAKIDHPSIASVLESGFHRGIPYIAMRYVEGHTLAAALNSERTPLVARSDSSHQRLKRSRIRDRILLLSKVARAIHVAHSAGVVHRDLKPANIMVSHEGEPIILDFGLASDAGESEFSLTATGDVFGTPSYMSPEQVRGERVDPRSDIYSLGVILHECTLERRPFVGVTREKLLQEILHREVVCGMEARRAYSADLGAVIEACLQKERNRRYQSADDLHADLLRLANDEPVRVKPISAFGRAYRSARRRPLVATLSILLGLSVLSLAGFVGFLTAKSQALTIGEETLRSDRLHHLLQQAYMDLGEGDRSRAVKNFAAILSEFPKSHEAVVGLSLGELMLGRPEQAYAALTDASVRDDPDFQGILELIAERGPQLLPDDWEAMRPARTPLACFIQGVIHLLKGHEGEVAAFARAQNFLEQAMVLSTSSHALYIFEWAHAVGHTRDREAAELVTLAIEQRYSDSAFGHYWAGFAWHGVDLQRAAAHLQEAVALDPTCGPAWHDFGNVLTELGRTSEAQKAFERACEFLGETPMPWNSLGAALPKEGDESAAKGHLERALAIDPRFAPAYVNLAALHHRQSRLDDAQQAIATALSIDDSDAVAWFNQGVIALQRKEKKQALASFQEAQRRSPSDTRTLSLLGDLLLEQGDTRGAIQMLRQGIEGGLSDAGAHARLGDALMATSDFDAASAAYSRALELEPRNATILARSAVPAMKAMEFLKARDTLEAAQALDDQDPVVKQLTQLLLPTARRGAQIEDHLHRFAEGADPPRDILFQDMVGVADRRQLNWTILLLWKSSPPRERLGLDLRLTMLLATASCVEGQGDSTDPAPRESLDHVRSLALEQLQNLIDDLIALRAQGSLTSKDQRVLTKLAASESLNPYLQATEHWPLSARLPWAVAWQRLEALLQSDSK